MRQLSPLSIDSLSVMKEHFCQRCSSTCPMPQPGHSLKNRRSLEILNILCCSNCWDLPIALSLRLARACLARADERPTMKQRNSRDNEEGRTRGGRIKQKFFMCDLFMIESVNQHSFLLRESDPAHYWRLTRKKKQKLITTFGILSSNLNRIKPVLTKHPISGQPKVVTYMLCKKTTKNPPTRGSCHQVVRAWCPNPFGINLPIRHWP